MADAPTNDATTPGVDPVLASLASLTERVERLESELAALRATTTGARLAAGRPPVPPPPPPGGALHPPPPPPTGPPLPGPGRVVVPSGTPPLPVARRVDAAFALSSESVLKWGGVGLVVLAVVFAVSTAISRGWIGPLAQLAGAVLVAAALVVLGWRLRPRRMPWSHALCSGGVLALYATFASSLFRDEMSDAAAFAMIAVVATGGFVLARAVPSVWVASTTVLGGHVAWIAACGGDDPPLGRTVAWVTAVTVIAVALSAERDWPATRVAAHLPGALVLAGLANGTDGSAAWTLVGAIPLAASLLRTPSLGAGRSSWRPIDIAVATIVGPWSLLVLQGALEIDGRQTLGATALVVACFVVACTWALRRSLVAAHRVALVASASVTITIGLALLVHGPAAMTAIAVQGAGLVLLWRRLDRAPLVLANGGALLTVAGLFALGRTIDAWNLDAPVGHDLAHLGIIVAVAAGSWWIGELTVRRLGAAAVLGLLLSWLGSVLVHLPEGQAVVSVSWAIVGVALFVSGAVRKHRDAATTGLAVIGLTVGKLLTVDLRAVDTLWRAGLFLLVGLGLLRLGFLLPSLTRDDAPPDTDAPSDLRPPQ